MSTMVIRVEIDRNNDLKVKSNNQNSSGKFKIKPEILDLVSNFNEKAKAKIDYSTIGKELFNSLLVKTTPTEEGIFLKYYNQFKQTGGKFLKIIFECDSPLSQIQPWELLYDDERRQFLCAEENISIIRSPPTAYVPQAEFKDKVKFVIIQSAKEDDLTRATTEMLSIKQVIENLDLPPNFIHCTVLSTGQGYDPPTRENIERELKDANIVHFIGHSIFEDGIGKIFLPDEIGAIVKKADHDFATWFSSESNVPNIGIVTLNSCRSGAEKGFGGLAKSLLMRRIPCVVAMQFDVPEPFTPDFSKVFYEFFLKDSQFNPEKAIIEARRALLNDRTGSDNPYYAAPVVYTALDHISENPPVFRMDQKQKTLEKIKNAADAAKKYLTKEDKPKERVSEFIPVEVDSNRSINLYDELKTNLIDGQLDQKFLYWSYRAIRRWYKVLSSNDYQISNWGTAALQNSNVIANLILDKKKSDEIDLISLGSGIGDKDCHLINAFMNYENAGLSLSYYPVDHSVFMLGETIRNAIEIRRRKFFQIIPILANFKYVNRLINVLKSPTNSRVLTMLGGTLANYPENMILNSLHGFMRENDYLLIDAEFHLDKVDAELIKAYDNKIGREFIAGPIEDIAEYNVDNGVSEMRIGEFSISGTLNEIRQRIKYVVDNTASPISKSRTIIGKLDQGHGYEITLFSATKYDKTEFENFLKRMKFNIVKGIPLYVNDRESSTSVPYAMYILQALT